MLRASALHMVIVIALVIAVICSSLITAAYFYRLQYQKTVRYHRLEDNLSSAMNIILASGLKSSERISLFEATSDSVIIERHPWGLFEVGIAQAFIQKDTIRKAFSIAPSLDSTKRCALYIIDEDRNISVSGKTEIRGTAYLPKAGIKQAYVNSQVYQGDARLVIGDKKVSGRELPVLNNAFLQRMEDEFKPVTQNAASTNISNGTKQSFLEEIRKLNYGKKVTTLSGMFSGNVNIHSDTLVIIDSMAKLDNIVVFAKAIQVNSGFRGRCQLFATDSISVGADCGFAYPSVLCVAGFDDVPKGQRKLALGRHSRVEGVVLVYEKAKTDMMPVLIFDKKCEITGTVYSGGLLNYQDNVSIKGSVYAGRFLYQTGYTRYENYLINIKINSPALSKYYLTSSIFPAASTHQSILQWLK